MKSYICNKVCYEGLFLLFLLCLGVEVRADNVVTVSAVEGAPGSEVTVNVSLANTDAVSALQVLIPLDERLTYVAGSAALTDRCASHSVTAGMKDGALSLMVFSISQAALSGNEGTVATFRLKLGNQPGTYPLVSTKTIVTDTDGNQLECALTSGTATVRCAKAQYGTMTVDFGSVPIRDIYQRMLTVTNTGNESLTVTGLQFSVYPTDFSSSTTFPLTIAPGSSAGIAITYAPQERGTVSETVTVVCNGVSKQNTIALKAQPYAVNELHMQDAGGMVDDTVTVAMTMNNMDAVSGFQLEFYMPNELAFVENSFVLSSRKQDHVLVQTVSDGVLRILCYSPTDKPFTGTDGELATMRFRLVGHNSTSLSPGKCLLTATINNQVTNVCSRSTGARITIGSPQISVGSTLDMGAQPVTEDAQAEVTVSNQGNVPLIINRVTFDREGFSVEESLPLTINPMMHKSLTVVYPSKEEVNFATTMQIYSNDPEQRLSTVNITGSRFAPNYLSIATPDIFRTEDLTVNISVDNYDRVVGVQFDLTYPSQYYEPYDNNYTIASRVAGMSVTMRPISDNCIRYFCYFLSGNGIEPGDGDVLSIRLRPRAALLDMQEAQLYSSSWNVGVSNVKLGTEQLDNKYCGGTTSSNFSIKRPSFNLTLDMPDEVYRTDNLTVSVGMDNSHAITSMQFDLTYPSRYYYYDPSDKNSVAVARAEGVAVASNPIDDNTIRYTLTGQDIEAGTGDVLNIRLRPTDELLTMSAPADVNITEVNITSQFIDNPNPVSNTSGWTAPKGAPNAFDPNNNCAEFWNQSGFSIRQTLHNLPAGEYKLVAVALSRTGHPGTLSAGDASVGLTTVGSDQVNNRSAASTWFNQGNGVNELLFTQETTGDVTIALTADSDTGGDHWTVWRSFALYRYETREMIDVTDQYVVNATPVVNANGWSAPKGAPNAFDPNNNCAEFWNQSGYSIEQTLHKLPAGEYMLEAIAFSRTGHPGRLSMGDATIDLVTVSGSVVNSVSQANTWFNQGNGVNDLLFTQKTTGDVTIALTADSDTGGDHWTVWRSFRLYQLGNNNLASGSVTVSNVQFTTVVSANTLTCDGQSASFVVRESPVTLGDVNGDGNIDTQDAIQVIRHYLGKEPDNFNVQAADVNGDGNIDTQDAIKIIRKYLGKE